MTPLATHADPSPKNWRVRVIPNTYPAVRGQVEGPLPATGLFHAVPAAGQHEVVVACPQHEASLAHLPAEHLAAVFRAFRERIRAIQREHPGLYPFIFTNHRAPAGASLEHAHAQIIALPMVPTQIRDEVNAGQTHFERTGHCVWCDLIAAESSVGSRVVLETKRFIALAAYAARFPCETWLLPRDHASRFEEITDRDLADLGSALRRVLLSLDRGLGDPSYNLILHNAADMSSYHWHLEILPRLTGAAGFEWGAGININPVPPEQAASYLRGIDNR